MTEDVTATMAGTESIRLQTAEALEEAARKLRTTEMPVTSEEFQDMLHGVQDKMDHLREEIGARYHELETEYHRQVEPVEDIICEHPIPAVLVAIGFGFLIGMLVGRHHQ